MFLRWHTCLLETGEISALFTFWSLNESFIIFEHTRKRRGKKKSSQNERERERKKEDGMNEDDARK